MKALLTGTFMCAYEVSDSNIADRATIMYANPFYKLRLTVVMSNVTSFLNETGDYSGAEYYDRDRMFCNN